MRRFRASVRLISPEEMPAVIRASSWAIRLEMPMAPPALAFQLLLSLQVWEVAGAATAMAPTAAIERRILFIEITPTRPPRFARQNEWTPRVLQFCGRAMLC